MNNCIQNQRRRAGHRFQGPEVLESRQLLSITLPAGIASVDPADGGALLETPQSVIITFDQPFIAYDASYLDIQIYPVVDGAVQVDEPVFSEDDPPDEIADPPGAPQNGSVLEIPLSSNGLTLPGGTYQIDVVGQSGLDFGLAGLYPSDPSWASGNDVPLAQFSLPDTGGVTIKQPTSSLGTVGTTIQTIAGVVGSANNGSPVDLYQINLAPGHQWEVGLAVAAASIGSTLLPDLTLFDAQGNVVKSSWAGLGLSSDPDDPYLFAGLAPGTYFVGVSAFQNAPYDVNGYNPVTGTQGLAGLNQPGGAFELSLLAVPHDQPTTVTGFSLTHADRFESSPTSMSIQFSSGIDWTSLFPADAPESSLEVVDQSGRVWPTTTVQYEASTATLELIFDRPLPAGSYQLVVPQDGGLTDLAGQPIVAPGEPAGILASWTVAPSPGAVPAGNLGVLWPSSAATPDVVGSGQFSQTFELAPGQAVVYSYILNAPGYFALETRVASGTVTALSVGSSGTTTLDFQTSAPLNTSLIQLNDGSYELRFINTGSSTAVVQWVFKSVLLEVSNPKDEAIPLNGVGQQSALGFMTLAPAPATTSAASVASIQAVVVSASPAGFFGSMGPIPTNLLVTTTSSLAGQPATDAALSSLASAQPAGAIAIASGLFSSLGQGPMSGQSPFDSGDDQTVADSAPADAKIAGMSPFAPGADATASRRDPSTLVGDDWLARLIASARATLVRLPGVAEVTARVNNPFENLTRVGQEPAVRTRDELAADLAELAPATVQADLAPPASLIVVVMAARLFYRPLQNAWRRTRGRARPRARSLEAGYARSPHFRAEKRPRGVTHHS